MAVLHLFITWLTGFILIRSINPGGGNNRLVFVSMGFPVGVAIYSIIFFLLNTWVGVELSQDFSRFMFFGGSLILVLIIALKSILLKGNEQKHFHGLKDGLYKNLRSWLCLELVVIIVMATIIVICTYYLPIKNWDAYMYHLSYAESLLKTGNLPTQADPSYQNMTNAYPPMVLIYYGLTWATNGSQNLLLPKLVTLFFAVSVFLLQVDFGKRHLKWSSSKLFFLILLDLSCYPVWISVIDETTDMPFAFFCFASLYYYFSYKSSGKREDLVWGLILASFSGWVKYHGFVWMIIYTVIISIHYFLNNRRIVKLTSLLATSMIAYAIILAPFLARNYLLYGNPVYPGLPRLLGGYMMNQWVLEYIVSFYYPGPPFSGLSPLVLLRLVFLLPIPLMLVELISGNKSLKASIKLLAIFGGIYLLSWMAIMIAPNSGDPLRFLLPSLLIFSMLASNSKETFNTHRNNPLAIKKILLYSMTFLSLHVIFVITKRMEILQPYHDYLPPAGNNTGNNTLYTIFRLVKNYFWIWTWVFLVTPGIITRYLPQKRKFILLLGRLVFYLVVILNTTLPSINDLFSTLPYYSHTPWWKQKPLISPGGAWMDNNLPKNAVLLSFEDRKYILPRSILPADLPELEPIYKDNVDISEVINILRKFNVSHVLITGYFEQLHPLFYKSPVFQNLHPPYFSLVYQQGNTQVYQLMNK